MRKFDSTLDVYQKAVIQCKYVPPDVCRISPLYTEYGMLMGCILYSAETAKMNTCPTPVIT